MAAKHELFSLSVEPEMTRSKKTSNVPSLACAFSASVTTGGVAYSFGIYAEAIKKSLEISQLQLDSVSAAIFVAGLFSWLPGLVVDRFGTRFSMMLGGTSGAFFSMTYWAVCRQFVAISRPVPVLAFLGIAVCLSCALIIGSMFKITVVCSGPGNRGAAVGVAKGFVGLGAGVYSCVFQAFRTPEESALDFLPVTSFFFLICVAMPSWLLLPTRKRFAKHLIQYDATPLHFRIMYASLLAVGVVVVGSSVTDLLHEKDPASLDGNGQRNYWRIALILSIWLGPIWLLLSLPRLEQELPIVADELGEQKQISDAYHEKDTSNLLVLQNSEDDADKKNCHRAEEEKKSLVNNYQTFSPPSDESLEKKDLNLLEMLQTSSAWLLLWTTTILVGSGTYKTNNMGEMVESLGFPEAVTPATLALFSVAQASARVVTGVVSEAGLKWNVRACCVDHGVPRPFFLVIASSIAFLVHLALAFSTSQTIFVIGCTISGIAFGMAWPLMVLCVGEIWGLENHGANYLFYDGFTKAVGTLFLSDYVAGDVYEANVDNGLSCFGTKCFQMTHLVVAGLALTGVAASLALQFTSRHAYNSLRSHTS